MREFGNRVETLLTGSRCYGFMNWIAFERHATGASQLGQVNVGDIIVVEELHQLGLAKVRIPGRRWGATNVDDSSDVIPLHKLDESVCIQIAVSDGVYPVLICWRRVTAWNIDSVVMKLGVVCFRQRR